MLYSGDGLMTSFTDPNLNETVFTYQPDGRLATDQDATGSLKQLDYVEYSRRESETTFTSGQGHQTRYEKLEYFNGNAETQVTFPSGLSNLKTRKPGAVSETIFADGMSVTTTNRPDPRWGMNSPYEREKRIVSPSGLEMVVLRQKDVILGDLDDDMNLQTITDNISLNGKTFANTYDAATRTWTSTSPMGREQFALLDTLGRMTSANTSGLHPVQILYDTYGRVQNIDWGALGEMREYSFTYDDRGFLNTVTDPKGRTTSYTNDETGRILKKTLPDTREILFSYDANGNLKSLTPPGKPAHEFDYTPVNLLSSYDPPDLLGVPNDITQYAYNLDRKIDLVTRPDGQTLDYVYDTAGRLSSIELPMGQNIGLNYHPFTGTINSISSPDSENLTFDFDGSLLTATTLYGTVAGQVTQTYNNDFLVETRDINGAHPATFTYDSDGLLEVAGQISLQRNTINGLLTGTVVDGVSSTNAYNDFGETESESYVAVGNPLYDVSYTRDELGRVATKTETIDGVTDTYVYEYDNEDRLYEVYKNSTLTSRYLYDENGNRLVAEDFSTGGQVDQNGIYDEQDRLISYGNSVDGYASYNYTDNGELDSKLRNGEEVQYDYDVMGNLKAVEFIDVGTTIEYLVDGLGRRVGRVVDGVVDKGFLYKDALNPIAELDASGAVVSRFVYGSKFNAPDYMVKSGVTYRIISNHLGSPKLVVNTATGDVVQRIDYDEFGRVTLDTNPGFQPFGFAGGLYDPDTGLVRFGARDYDAEIGRWTSKDPIRFAGKQANLYGYSFNDPVNWIDVNGLTQSDIDVAVDVISKRTGLRPVPVSPNDPPGDETLGSYDPISDTVSIDESYLGNLDKVDQLSLLQTLIHEFLHANESWPDRFMNNLKDIFGDDHPEGI